MGLYATGQNVETVTPVFIPKSTGNIQTLPRNKLGQLLSCPTDQVETVVSPVSTLFGPEYHIVCAYDVGAGGLASPDDQEPLVPFSNAPGDPCFHAVHMTRSLVHSFGLQINGNALFFYLQPGKDFLLQPDFSAVREIIEAWDEMDGNCTQKTFNNFAEMFATNVRKHVESTAPLEYLDVIIFPALDGKPFIAKHPVRYYPPEPATGDPPFHTIDRKYILGDDTLDYRTIGRTPSRGNLQHQLRVYMRDRGRLDGSPINLSIRVATEGMARYPWPGNIVVLKRRGSSEVGMNADAEDVKIAIEYFKLYGV